jgi:hypothetical protein
MGSPHAPFRLGIRLDLVARRHRWDHIRLLGAAVFLVRPVRGASADVLADHSLGRQPRELDVTNLLGTALVVRGATPGRVVVAGSVRSVTLNVSF